MKTIILCGGKGVRAFPFTEYLPKPMLPIRGTPILVHLIRNYICQGFKDFILAAGHRKAVLDDYFYQKDMGADIKIVDTGDGADTGDRIYACREYVDSTFMATYGDGLSDVPLAKLMELHRSHGKLATVTTVPLHSQYGMVETDEHGVVSSLKEKPVMLEHQINAGFFVFEPDVFNHWSGNNLEREVLSKLVEEGQLAAYRHHGFFKSMDSYKEQQEFEEMQPQGKFPWQVG